MVEYFGYAARRARVYETADNGAEVLASERWVIPALNTSLSLSHGLGTTNGTAHNPWSQQRTVTTTYPDDSFAVTLYTNGVLASVTRLDSINNPLSTLNYSYDSHGRQHQVMDARNGATTYTYNAADQVQTVTTPSPDGVAGGLLTTTYYDQSLRATNVVHADSTSTRSDYFANGLPQKTWGSRIYPVEYQYDHAGRMETRTWARPIGGNPLVTTFTYNDAGLVLTESYSGGPLNGISITNGYDQYTSRDVPGYVNVIGTASNSATVTLTLNERRFKVRREFVLPLLGEVLTVLAILGVPTCRCGWFAGGSIRRVQNGSPPKL